MNRTGTRPGGFLSSHALVCFDVPTFTPQHVDNSQNRTRQRKKPDRTMGGMGGRQGVDGAHAERRRRMCETN
ncbi:hypothetical protein ZHAS_00008870 [Anopheles sinensis]|uniref:Uncharacterized protein n=1 Tax=Anopheles sinensis TaxID=74873 RepID=A0A084VTI4_ANOSI|nr:hypothetical protein ZHAS_00008870 [Anopheles sinensis]